MISHHLLANGCRFIVARSGAEIIQRTKEERPDLILMDVHLPGVDGLELIRRLRSGAVQDNANAPREPLIIATTTLTIPGDGERFLAAGANEFLSKPLNPKRLIQMIESEAFGRQVGQKSTHG